MKVFQALSIIAIVVLGSSITAQSELGMPFVRNYHPKDYQAYSQNWSIVQDKQGLLYFANGDGVLEYDGQTWRKIILPSNLTPSSLCIDNQGVIWIGGKSEIGYLKPFLEKGNQYISLLSLVPEKYSDFGFVSQIVSVADGVYFNAGDRVFRYSNKRITVIEIARPSHLCNLGGFPIICQNGIGLCVISGDKVLRIKGGEIFNDALLRSILPYKGDTLLFVDRKNGLFAGIIKINKLYDATAEIKKIENQADAFIISNEVYNAIPLSNGYFAFSTMHNGTLITDNSLKSVQILNRQSRIQNETHTYLLEDRQENLWIAMDNGISKVQLYSPFTFWDDMLGLKGTAMDVIRFDNTLFVATWQGVFYLNKNLINGPSNNTSNDKQEAPFQKIDKIRSQCWTLSVIQRGGVEYLWAATSDGLFEIDKNYNVRLVAEGGYNFIYQNLERPEIILAGTEEGVSLFHFAKGNVSGFTSKIPGIDGRVTSIIGSSSGTYWVGCEFTGVFKIIVPESFSSDFISKICIENFDSTQGLPYSEYYYVHNFDGTPLVLTRTGINLIIDRGNNNFEVTGFDSYFDRFFKNGFYINILRRDKNDGFWLQTSSKSNGNKNLYYVRMVNGSFKTLDMPFKAFPDIEIYTIFNDRNNVTWFGCDDGVFRFDRSKKVLYSHSYSALIRKVIKGNDQSIFAGHYFKEDTLSGIGEPLSIQPEDQIPQIDYADNNMKFEFSAASFCDEDKMLFQYKLEGFDENWTSWMNLHYKEYTNLPPGSYTFRVRAMNVYGIVSQEASYQFRIIPPWYRTILAFVLYGLIAIFILAFGITFTNRRLIKAKQRLETIVHNRTLEIQNQKKEIEKEKDKADRLLLNILPVRIAEELKTSDKCQTEFYQSASVLFTDFASFTKIAEDYDPEELITKLDQFFIKFDEICVRNRLEKIKTIGDSHMSVGGIPVRNRTHAIDATLAALEMQSYMKKLHQKSENDNIWQLRIGIHTGEVIAGVVGKKKFAFDIWGDTVNIASRLQDAGVPGKVNISTETAKIIEPFFKIEYRGKIAIKHKGPFDMYFVESIHPDLSIGGEGIKPSKAYWDLYRQNMDTHLLTF